MESFERKLEEAQKNLNIPAKDFIPVIYQDEVDYAAQLISFVPMIAIGGKSYFLISPLRTIFQTEIEHLLIMCVHSLWPSRTHVLHDEEGRKHAEQYGRRQRRPRGHLQNREKQRQESEQGN